ncbi:MAG: YerC/YecD family TrpR-related protein [Synergistota bacterium]|nr:YerC/YecD family TrpR-related protein [Synergistota bacterium]
MRSGRNSRREGRGRKKKILKGNWEKWRSESTDQLCKAFLCLKTIEECYAFLEDIATIAEIKALAQRFEVAKLLAEGYTYAKVAEKTGASSATISRVKRALEYGAGGYTLVIDRLKKTGETKEEISTGSSDI